MISYTVTNAPGVNQVEITNVIFNDPATIVFWSDDIKTVVKCCDEDTFVPTYGLAMAICKRLLGGNYKKVFKQWVPRDEGAAVKNDEGWISTGTLKDLGFNIEDFFKKHVGFCCEDK